MLEYNTKYPKSIMLEDQSNQKLIIDPREGVEQLHVVVFEENFEKLYQIFQNEGFTKIKFEHKQPFQLESGLSLKLNKPWEMHLRLASMNDDNDDANKTKNKEITIHAEVEVSRDYMQHLFSQRTPVIYEVIKILERNKIESKIWSNRIKKYVKTVNENYKIKLATPSLPLFAWKPMVYSIGTVGLFYLVKYLLTI